MGSEIVVPTDVVFHFWKGLCVLGVVLDKSTVAVCNREHTTDLQLTLVSNDLLFDVGGAEFDLDTLRTSLDEKGLEIAANQDGSLKSRKRLADFTKGVVMVFW